VSHFADTPLVLALSAGHVSIARVLLEAGAAPSAAHSDTGYTPLHFAAINGDADLVGQGDEGWGWGLRGGGRGGGEGTQKANIDYDDSTGNNNNNTQGDGDLALMPRRRRRCCGGTRV
jgi:hypothetical protein